MAPRIRKFLIVIGAVFQLVGCFLVKEVVLAQGDGLVGTDLIAPMAIAGIGLTLILVRLSELSLAQTDVENADAIGIAVISVVFFDAVGVNFSPAGLRDGFELAIWVPLVSVALTGLTSFLLPTVSQMVAHNLAAEV